MPDKLVERFVSALLLKRQSVGLRRSAVTESNPSRFADSSELLHACLLLVGVGFGSFRGRRSVAGIVNH